MKTCIAVGRERKWHLRHLYYTHMHRYLTRALYMLEALSILCLQPAQ